MDSASHGFDGEVLKLNDWMKKVVFALPSSSVPKQVKLSQLSPPNLLTLQIKLSENPVVVMVASTTGNGDPPENMQRFWRHVRKTSNPKDMLANLRFCVLGLGDTNYDKFCHMGKQLDRRLPQLGANKFYETGLADEGVGLESVVEPWIEGLWPALKGTGSAYPLSLHCCKLPNMYNCF